jgi:hypothetical protein
MREAHLLGWCSFLPFTISKMRSIFPPVEGCFFHAENVGKAGWFSEWESKANPKSRLLEMDWFSEAPLY